MSLSWKPWKKRHRSKLSFDLLTPVTSNTASIRSEPPGRTSFGTESLNSTLVGPGIDLKFFDEQRTSFGIDETYKFPWSIHKLQDVNESKPQPNSDTETSETNLDLQGPQPRVSHSANTNRDRPPFPRYGHTTSVSSDEHQFIIFGGVVGGRRTNEVYSIDPTSFTYQRLETTGDKPCPRCGHTAVLYGCSLVVWGGETRRNADDTGDLDKAVYILDIGSFMCLFVSICEESVMLTF